MKKNNLHKIHWELGNSKFRTHSDFEWSRQPTVYLVIPQSRERFLELRIVEHPEQGWNHPVELAFGTWKNGTSVSVPLWTDGIFNNQQQKLHELQSDWGTVIYGTLYRMIWPLRYAWGKKLVHGLVIFTHPGEHRRSEIQKRHWGREETPQLKRDIRN